MDQDLFDQLAQRIDALVADRNRLKTELEQLKADGGAKNQELELELEAARADAEGARTELQAARAEIQEREARIQAATSRVQSLIERLQAE